MTTVIAALVAGYVFTAGTCCERWSTSTPTAYDRRWQAVVWPMVALGLAVVWPVTSVVAWWLMRRPMVKAVR